MNIKGQFTRNLLAARARLQRIDFLCTKFIQSNVKKFGYLNHPITTRTPFACSYCPPTKLRKGNVFSRVCPSFCPQGTGGGSSMSNDVLDITIQGSSCIGPWLQPLVQGPYPVQGPTRLVQLGPHCTRTPLSPCTCSTLLAARLLKQSVAYLVCHVYGCM